MTLHRRAFLGAAAAALAAPSVARAASPRLVVVGGGPGGATLARAAAKAGGLEVVLVDSAPAYAACFFSNAYIGGLRPFESLTQGFERLASSGLTLKQAKAVEIDPAVRTLMLEGGEKLAYDALALAPGIDFKWDAVEGLTPELAETTLPHAYKGGAQARLLRQKLDAMADGETVIVTAPDVPYRCPPGPYERVSMIARLLTKAGKTRSKIIILDAKDKFSKQELFLQGWRRFYPGMIDWISKDFTDGGVESVDPKAMTVTTKAGETVKGDVINLIAPQKAGAIIHMGGISQGKDWAAVDPATLASKADPRIYVVGDACANGDMPKSAFAANSQAKVAAMSIRAALLGEKAFPARYFNTCWSFISDDHAVKVGGSFRPGAEKIESVEPFLSKTDETDAVRAAAAHEWESWRGAFVKDVWG